MSDARLRSLERTWRGSGNVEDETRFLLERVRVGQLTEAQLYTAAYLDHEAAIACFADGLYDDTGLLNDHLEGICPCGNCRWHQGHITWINGLLGWAQNLPFPGIDGPHAEQEMLIRMGRALAGAVQAKVYDAIDDTGSYRQADVRADRFLRERTDYSRKRCRQLWVDPDWGDPEWTHQILYYIVNPSGWRQNMHHWFRESGDLLFPCTACGNKFPPTIAGDLDALGLGLIPINCKRCDESRPGPLLQARKAVEKALIPWVLQT